MKRVLAAGLGALTIVAASVGAGLAQGPSGGAPSADPLTEIVPSTIDTSQELQRATRPDSAVLRKRKRGPRNLDVGFGDLNFVSTGDVLRRELLDVTKRLNGKPIRLYVDWRKIAPCPDCDSHPDFNAADPGAPGYNWSRIDDAVKDARDRGLRPLMLVNAAPDWAEGPNRPSTDFAPTGSWKPRPADIADFGTALAKRYKGKVRDYMLWNEPNLPQWLTPQRTAPSHYRSMLNAYYGAVHKVGSKNRVITGGTAPYGGGPSYGQVTTRPLKFWRDVMCVRDNRRLSPKKCPQKAKFDVLSHHPINTSGGPRKSAINDDDISTADLKNLVRVLRASERKNNVKGARRHPVWATEIWWETNPPDPGGVNGQAPNPSWKRQAQWYQEALYVLWKQGASMVLFYQVRDEPYTRPGRDPGDYQTGVQTVSGKPKPSSTAVRFPFVADRKSKKQVLLWGKAPKSGRLTVSKGKRRVAGFRVRKGKVFTKTVRLRKGKGKYQLRAKVGSEKSLVWTVK